MSDDEIYDVVQIGYGPVGQVTAALLGRAGHTVAVFERWPSVYPLPRAGHIDHEIMRILQGIGAAEHVERHAIPIPDYDWFNGAGELLLHMDWDQPTPSAWKSDYLMYQPYLEDALMAAVGRASSVDVHHGWEAVEVRQRPDHVEVGLREGTVTDGRWLPTGVTRTVAARYLVGADGAGSRIRTASGIAWDDYGFEEDWLVLDVRPHDPELEIAMPEAGQICDPARPVSLFRWLGREHARWEFMLLPGETAQEMTAPEKAWELLARWGLTPDNAAVVRRTVYTFRSLIADSFRRDRVLLVGDAAHLMPPFMGQGMCSGIRDAANLAWKLDLVLRYRAAAELLDAYDEERRPHVDQLIRTSMALGQIVCISDPDAAAARDEAFRTGQAPPPPPFPWLTAGVLATTHEDDGHTGRLGTQGRITRGGRTGLADDVVGSGWTVLLRDRTALGSLTPEQLAVIDTIGAHTVHVTRAGCGGDSAVDLDATYHRWFVQLGASAIIVRPDFYVYGVAPAATDLGPLLDRLREQLHLLTAVPLPRLSGVGSVSRPSGAVSEAEAAAHLRAMPMQRLVGNGMEWADAHELHRRVTDLEPWSDAAAGIADATRERARRERAAGHHRTASELFLHASAAYRFGQVPLPDGAAKTAMYRRLVDAYRDGVARLGRVTHVQIPHAGRRMAGWLHRPAGAPTCTPPVVIVLGGFDGWREEFHTGARRLVEAGLAVLLIDGPGQGETRLFSGLPMPARPADLDDALRAVVSWTQGGQGLGPPAVWGNSMGGYLAARLAARDDRIVAVCVNGGTDRPAEILDRYPRFVAKVQALYGVDDADRAVQLLNRHQLGPADLARLTAPLLVLHGEPDRIFLVAAALGLAAGAGGSDSTLRTWSDGDHCLYNHTSEKNALVADWFTDRLRRG